MYDSTDDNTKVNHGVKGSSSEFTLENELSESQSIIMFLADQSFIENPGSADCIFKDEDYDSEIEESTKNSSIGHTKHSETEKRYDISI